MQGHSLEPFYEGSPSGQQGAQPSILDWQWVVRVLRLRWKLIIVAPALAFSLTYGILRIVPPVYKSTAELLLFDPRQQVENVLLQKQGLSVDLSSVAINTEIEVLRSKSLTLRVAKELELDKDVEFYRAKTGWFGLYHPEQTANDYDRLDAAAETLLKNLQVEPVPYSYATIISVGSRSAEKARRLAASVAENYLTIEREAREEALYRAANWLNSRIQELQARVQKSESAIQELTAKLEFTDTGGKADVIQEQTSDLSKQLMQARNDVAAKGAALQQAKRALETDGNIEGIGATEQTTLLSQLRAQKLELERRVSVLQHRFDENHPEIISLKSQLDNVTKATRSEAAHIVNTMKNAYDATVYYQQSLQSNLRELTGERRNSPDHYKIQELRKLAEADRKLYETYITQVNQISAHQPLQNASARIITPATLPRSPSSSRLRFYAFGGLFGLCAGLAVAFGLEVLRRGIKTKVEAERAFGYPVLGVIPIGNPERSPQHEAGWLANRLAETPFSELGETIRHIRFQVNSCFASPSPKVVLVTSALAGEGKSTTAMLLAASYASSGDRTIIVDCDLRRHNLSEMVGVEQAGIADFLAGEIQIQQAICRLPLGSIDVITAGRAPSEAADALTIGRVNELLTFLRERYDTIILDASPLLTVVDGLVFAKTADKIVVVAEWSSTPRDAIAEAFKTLGRDADRVAGVVLNKVDLRELRAYGYTYNAYS